MAGFGGKIDVSQEPKKGPWRHRHDKHTNSVQTAAREPAAGGLGVGFFSLNTLLVYAMRKGKKEKSQTLKNAKPREPAHNNPTHMKRQKPGFILSLAKLGRGKNTCRKVHQVSSLSSCAFWPSCPNPHACLAPIGPGHWPFIRKCTLRPRYPIQ